MPASRRPLSPLHTHPPPPSSLSSCLSGLIAAGMGTAKISSNIVLEGRVTSDAFSAATLKHLKVCSSKLSPLEISLWQLQSAYELLGPSSPRLMFFLSFCRLSDCHLHTLHFLINLSLFLPDFRASSHLFPCHPHPPTPLPFLTSLSTLVTYFLSGRPRNTPARSRLIAALLSCVSLSCLVAEGGTLIRKLWKMWS